VSVEIVYPIDCDDCGLELRRGDGLSVSRSHWHAQGWHVQCSRCRQIQHERAERERCWLREHPSASVGEYRAWLHELLGEGRP
jgi:hypothetical protein